MEELHGPSKIPLHGPTRPERTRPEKVRGICVVGSGPVGSGRARVVEFCYHRREERRVQFAASVTTIFRQNGSSVNTIIKRTLDPGLYLSNFISGVEALAIEVDDRANA